MDTFYSVNDDGKVIQNLVFEYVTRSLETYMDDFLKTKKYIPIEKIYCQTTFIRIRFLPSKKYCPQRFKSCFINT